jgi:hypothetical protein
MRVMFAPKRKAILRHEFSLKGRLNRHYIGSKNIRVTCKVTSIEKRKSLKGNVFQGHYDISVDVIKFYVGRERKRRKNSDYHYRIVFLVREYLLKVLRTYYNLKTKRIYIQKIRYKR